MKLFLLYKLASWVRDTPTADDEIPGDLPSYPNFTTFGQGVRRIPPPNVIRNMLSFSRNLPVIERHELLDDIGW